MNIIGTTLLFSADDLEKMMLPFMDEIQAHMQTANDKNKPLKAIGIPAEGGVIGKVFGIPLECVAVSTGSMRKGGQG